VTFTRFFFNSVDSLLDERISKHSMYFKYPDIHVLLTLDDRFQHRPVLVPGLSTVVVMYQYALLNKNSNSQDLCVRKDGTVDD